MCLMKKKEKVIHILYYSLSTILYLNITVLYFGTLSNYHNTERIIAINIIFLVLGATFLI